ncbi:MAG: NAD(P)H-dependent oxidoreductase [Lewinellaceae bacterium]|nr:NAD(P)H-dependent oxidoreductase [Lewinellaceae bacterium]
MITIISGTNRRDSLGAKVARQYAEMLRERTTEEVKLLALEEVPHDWFHAEMYAAAGQSPTITKIQDEYILPAEKIVYVISEYNGSFPGVVKLFIDALSVRHYQATFRGKKAAMIGVGSGRGGNLRGMEHLTGILHYLGTIILPNKLPISRISELKDDQGEIIDPDTLKEINKHIAELLAF